MKKPVIKVNGLRDEKSIRKVSEWDIDILGLDFRRNSPQHLEMISSMAGIIPDYSKERLSKAVQGISKPDENRSQTTTSNLNQHQLMRAGIFADEMPQTIITYVYNYSLDFVQLDGYESNIMMDNLKRTLIPDIAPHIRLIKTIKATTNEEIATYKTFEGAADLLIICPQDAEGHLKLSLLDAYEGQTPFLIGGNITASDLNNILVVNNPKFIGIDLSLQDEDEMSNLPLPLIHDFIIRMSSPSCRK